MDEEKCSKIAHAPLVKVGLTALLFSHANSVFNHPFQNLRQRAAGSPYPPPLFYAARVLCVLVSISYFAPASNVNLWGSPLNSNGRARKKGGSGLLFESIFLLLRLKIRKTSAHHLVSIQIPLRLRQGHRLLPLDA